MQHFSSGKWTDFVRKALSAVEAQDIQSHLDSGCKQCTAAFAAWTRVRDFASRESGYEPPVAAVKMAKAALKLHGSHPKPSVAQLLFDSFTAPALAGVRSSSHDSRQMLYGFEDYRVDVRFEPNFDTDHALLVGQVLKSTSTGKNVAHVTVALVRGGKILGTAKTNEFGEFQLECDLGGRLELQLTLPDGSDLKVPMVEPTAESLKKFPPQVAAAKGLKRRGKSKSKRTRK
jgi:hypothetical protein